MGHVLRLHQPFSAPSSWTFFLPFARVLVVGFFLLVRGPRTGCPTHLTRKVWDARVASASPFARDQRRQPQLHPFETTRPLATDVPFSSHRQSGNKETPHELRCPKNGGKKRNGSKRHNRVAAPPDSRSGPGAGYTTATLERWHRSHTTTLTSTN